MRLSKQKFHIAIRLFVILISFFLILLLTYRLYIVIKFVKKDTKFILYWIQMWNSKTFGFGADKYDLFKNCKYKNCFATHDRRLIPLNKFDAIVFHGAEYDVVSYKRPSIRHSHQRYIFANMESPKGSCPVNLDLYASFYNWTMTYRKDSDIFFPYGYVIKNKTGYVMPSVESIKNRTLMAAWSVSNCYTPNRREILFHNLHLYLDIDVYGACGSCKCSEDKDIYNNYIVKHYKFYLAFENSHCKDYVTEKLYMALERDIVPIVYGDVDYDTVAPPHSVIAVDRFGSVKDLVDYILFLDKNITEYLKYFEWKKNYSIDRNKQRTACKLCEMLNDPSQPRKVYKNIDNWWFGENYNYCKDVNELSNLTRIWPY
ncbi:hypothetical protein ILUMI_12843 [Ignelater luminosus]|uniref:Fucosyltransferase n=1 Tax=Ignelater luminosus TaxID=2038154 RepID=A0A8K0CTF7_IGNLU|nr:hypothetical protein ILUMI_12843 [Ignelater luminosus]